MVVDGGGVEGNGELLAKGNKGELVVKWHKVLGKQGE